MDNNAIAKEFRFFRAFKDGRVEVFYQTQKLPPFTDLNTGVQSKDVIISTDPPVSARVFLPKIHDPNQKLPLLYYIHGGGFCFESAFSPIFHHHLMALVAEANVVAVSIEYGLFPERPLPGAYEDSWAGLQWIAKHVDGNGPESWLNDHADFNRFFIGGDSGGANMGTYIAIRVGSGELSGLKILGMVMVHPFFGGMEDDEMWMYMNPSNKGVHDPKLKPPIEDLAKLSCEKMLIFFAEKDHLRGVGGAFYEDLKKSEYKGNVEVVEHEGEAHDFHLFNPTTEKALNLMKKFASFLNEVNEVSKEFRFFRAYRDGKIEIFYQTQKLPPSTDPDTGVQSKDVVISTYPPVSARVFLPEIHDPTQKLPLLYYIHGGGYCFESAFSPIFHNHLMALAAEANVIAVSIEYGLFPERPLPGAYEDSWAGLRWIAKHVGGNGPESWLNDHADFNRFFIGGDSGGANMGIYIEIRVGSGELSGLKILGMVMVHPFFGGMEDDEMWIFMNPSNEGVHDPKLKPPIEDLAKLPCERILIFFAEKDHLRGVGGTFYEDLKKSEYQGSVEVVEHEGEAHEFHLFNPTSDKAKDLVKKFASFLNQV